MALYRLIISFCGLLQIANAQKSYCEGSDLGVYPHPHHCQKFINCSSETPSHYSKFLAPHEDECDYPQLFDVRDLVCKDFSEAECGEGRVAPKDPCDYFKNKCSHAHCEPCPSRIPSCVNHTDGVHYHPLKKWSPIFMNCSSERTISVQWCPRHQPTGAQGRFSPDKMKCVSPYEVPRAKGGLEPSCDGRPSRKYLATENPIVFFVCPEPVIVYYCPNGSRFNETRAVCEPVQ